MWLFLGSIPLAIFEAIHVAMSVAISVDIYVAISGVTISGAIALAGK